MTQKLLVDLWEDRFVLTLETVPAFLGRGSTQSGAFTGYVDVEDLDGVFEATVQPGYQRGQP